MHDDLLFRPVGELAALVRDGQLSSRELVTASLERIEALDSDLNAFVELDAERALATADQVQPGDARPFAGVPIAIKNNKPVDGLLLTFGADLMGDHRAGHDAFVVRRLREAGFVIVGTTTLPEYGVLPVTETRRFGATRNPWDLERTPGGSSGGAAAAVAAGAVPIAHGNDGGGSIRIPAACCGLVGLKPARGRISYGPDLGDSLLAQDGVLTHTISETAQLLDLLSGYEPGDATWASPPAEPFATAAARMPDRLRIGFTSKPPLEHLGVDPVCERAMHDAAALLESLGHEIEEVTPPWTAPGLLELFSASFSPAVSLSIGFAATIAGREAIEQDMEALSWHLYSRSREVDSVTALGATVQLQAYARGIVGWALGYDAILTPALAQRPVAIGEIDPQASNPAAQFARSGAFTPFTAIANVTGQPAISLPLFHGDDGLPTGVQLIGRPADEATLLSLGAQLEAACPWIDRRPPIAAPAQA